MVNIHMGQSLQARQEQQLKLAPRMIQSMEILQMPLLDLQEKIEMELHENPVLDLDSTQPSDDYEPSDAGEEPELAPEDEKEFDPEGVIEFDEDNQADFNRLDEISRQWDDVFDDDHRPSRAGLDEQSDRKHDAMQNMPARPQSLRDHLEEQLTFLELEPDMERLVRHVISCVDRTGYLGERIKEKLDDRNTDEGDFHPLTLDQVAERYDLYVTPRQVDQALKVVQSLDPPGVGARDLRECLLLQVMPETPHAELVRMLIRHHLEDIQHNRLPLIQKNTQRDIATIKEAIEELKHLTTRPGSPFIGTQTRYVKPDVLVDKNDAGKYEVRLADDWLPSLRISKSYARMARDGEPQDKTTAFLRDKLMKAQWLIDAINQRRSTLLKVSQAIVDHQSEFLDRGPEHIRPLKMQQIADLVGVHVTTVSRAVDDKWAQTPRGVFSLRRFFGGGQTVKNDEGGDEMIAWEKIEQKLLELVENEDKSDPLSDEDLVLKLNEAGYPIARRTVTKYRKKLRIPSSRQRKSW